MAWREIIYQYDGSFEGLLCCVFESYTKKERPTAILHDGDEEPSLFEIRAVVTDRAHAQRIYRSLYRRSPDVGPFLRRCAAEFYESPAAGDSTLELELTQAAEHTVVQADEALLLRAIENLLHNTVGHNAAPVHVTIRADAADGMLTIQVTDDGQGYPPAVLAVLQAGETGENPPHILGLHVVEQILAAHGGTVAFAQALPHGAAAALTLPL